MQKELLLFTRRGFSYTIGTFKIRLDRFWFDQEIKYNWKADIHTGSRSQVDVILN